MRSSISQFIAPALLALLCLVSIECNGITAKQYANSREMVVEHRLDDFGNQPEGRDHHSGHSEGYHPSKSEDKYKRPKPTSSAPKPQYRPSKLPSFPSKALHPAPANRPSSNSFPAYKPTSYTPPSYSPPAYTSSVHTPLAHKPAANRPTAYSSPAYKPPAYNPSTQTPPAYNPSTQTPPAHNPSTQTPPAYNPSTQTPPAYNPSTQTPPAYSSSAYTPASNEPPAYTEASTYHPLAHSTPAYSPPAYAASLSESEYPYQHVPEASHGVSKGTSFDKDFPNFDDFVQQSIKFDQFKI